MLFKLIATGVVGAYLAKSEGRIIINKIKSELNEGRVPGNEIINGLCVLIGGINNLRVTRIKIFILV